MLRHPFLKLGLLAAGAASVYTFVLNDDAKQAVRTAASTVNTKSKELLTELKIIKEDLSGTSVEKAQAWAADQWAKAGF